jgi:hypothetical protein
VDLVDKLNENLQKPPAPIMGGLITDPIPQKIRLLEERVAKLEAIIKNKEI